MNGTETLRRRIIRTVAVLVVLGGVLFVMFHFGASGGTAPPPPTHTVTYLTEAVDAGGLAGPHTVGAAALTYATLSGITQDASAALPDARTVTGVPGSFVPALSAQLLSGTAGVAGVRCTVLVDGVVVAQNTASGMFAVASCVVSPGG